MNVISAREILNQSRHAVWHLPKGVTRLQFEDQHVTEIRTHPLIFNRYCWELLTLFPNTPITRECCVTHVLNGGTFTADTHIELLKTLFYHICRHNQLQTYAQKEPLLRMIYHIVDLIHNEILEGVAQWVTTIDALDFIKVVEDPVIKEIHANLRPTPEGVDYAYKQIKHYINGSELSNRFVAAYRNKSANDNQSNQCIGPRGFISGRDLTVYLQPVMNGFIRGVGSLYELLVESLTAAKALAANERNIKRSEYTSRRIQLLAMVVEAVVPGDCGSTEYMEILVTNTMLDVLRGKYYLKPDNTLACIQGDETHLVDHLIKVRSTLGCKHPNASHVCSTCLGDLGHSFPVNSNLGYMMAAYLMEKITQAILSTKHLTHSVKKSLIQLSPTSVKYLRADEEGDLYFHQNVDLTGLQLILPNNKLKKLVDVLNLDHTNINLNKIGELDEVIIRDTKVKNHPTERLSLNYKDRNCIITKALLQHMKYVKIETDSRTNFIVPLDGFDKDQPIFNSPLKEANILNFVNQISDIIEKKHNKVTNPYEKLHSLAALVFEKFKINYSVLEVLIYATTTYNAPAGNYRLGRNSQYPYCETALTLFANRDFAAFAAYERQTKYLIEEPMTTFGDEMRQSHPIALFFTPQALAAKN